MENDTIRQELEEVKKSLAMLKTSIGIDRDMDVEQQDELTDIVKDRIADITWDDYVHYTTFFDSLDSTEDSGASVAANRLFMSAAGTNTVDYTRFRRIYQNIFSFDAASRFRTAFDVGGPSLTTGSPMEDIEAYIGTGSTGTGSSEIFGNGLSDNSHYGFYVQNGYLYGITSDGSSFTTTTLSEVNVYDLFFVEAIHYPRERVDFYVSDASNAITNPEVKPTSYRGSISTTLPLGTRKALYEFSVKNSDGTTGDKDLDVGFLEILQKK